jgi:hypothetical protein
MLLPDERIAGGRKKSVEVLVTERAELDQIPF